MNHVKLYGTDGSGNASAEAGPVCGAELVEVKVDVKGELKVVHERELLVDKAWQSDCPACRKPLLHHIRADYGKNGRAIKTACGAEPIAPTVAAAMASDCDDCRTAAGVGLIRDKMWGGEAYGVRPEATFEPEPMANADEICSSARANR